MIFERDRQRLLLQNASQTNIGSRKLLLNNLKQSLFRQVSGRWMFRLAKFLFFFILFGYLLWLWIARPQVIIDENFGESDPTSADSDITKIETLCSQSTSTCYSVVDIINHKTASVQRGMYIDGFEKEYDTVKELIPPKGMTFETSDTRMWTINNTAITTQYVAAMITQLFTTSALPLEDSGDSERELLVIGLGGGNFDMFLHTKRQNIKITVVELEPVVVQLATRWFGVVDNDQRKTVIKDGIVAISEAKDRASKYDAVILDACDNTKEMPCPAKTFLTDQILINIKSILKPMGTLIVNILPLKRHEINVEKVVKTLLSHFPVCIKMHMSYEANVVVSCLPYSFAADNLDDTKQLILQRAETATNNLGIHRVLEYLDLTIVLK
uniref:Uncharacterized protein n=1 Tax=Panagrolaimus superbus TaxID=310955 RepID=A0A914Z1A5_9BILA